MSSQQEITRLLADMCMGNKEAGEALLPYLYDELHGAARHYMRGERPGHTLQTTALINEAYIRLLKNQESEWESRAHFLRVASKAMRRVLIDHARGKKKAKRGSGWKRISLDEAPPITEDSSACLLDLDTALSDLCELDPQTGEVFELRFFGGLTAEETAQVMGISIRTVMREWRTAKAWIGQDIFKGEAR